ncbi:hypothetical protein ACJIZ3_003502 [Penstemon smallii]|uniref:BZIP domain-containing protein n=1 Tax=Penstemon smallii TaxID=265156 RepID=A0ABD3U9E0_9LAMI
MDHERSKKDLRNAKARQRYAARSVQQKRELARRRGPAIARDSALCSLPPVIAPVDPSQFDCQSDLHINSSLRAAVRLTSVEPASNLALPALLTDDPHVHSENASVGPLPVNDLHSVPSDRPDVHLRMSAVSRLIDPSSLSFAFETGQTSGCSLKVSNANHCNCSIHICSLSFLYCCYFGHLNLLFPHVITCRPGRPRRVVDRFSRLRDVPTVPGVLPTVGACIHCGAHRFFREGSAFCCSNGQICLPKSLVSSVLHFLFTDLSEISCEFRRRACTYNNAFAFTSIGSINTSLSIRIIARTHQLYWKTNTHR